MSRITVADFGSFARVELGSKCSHKTCEVETTFQPITKPKMDAGAVEVRSWSIDHTRRCCRHSLCDVQFSVFLRGSCSRKHVVLKTICSILAVVVSFVEGSVRRNAKIKGLLVLLLFCYRPRHSRNYPFHSFRKTKRGTDFALLGSRRTGLRHEPEAVLPLLSTRERFQRQGVRRLVF